MLYYRLKERLRSAIYPPFDLQAAERVMVEAKHARREGTISKLQHKLLRQTFTLAAAGARGQRNG